MINSNKFIPDSTEPTTANVYRPPACRKCGSKDTTSAAKRPTANSYWRCLQCGDVWNPAQSMGRIGR